MKVLDQMETAAALAKALKKPVLFVSWGYEAWPQAAKHGHILAAPYITFKDHGQAILNGQAVIVCDSDKERDKLYNQTVGDDGPTKTNKYKGKVLVYALTIDANGNMLGENT